MAALHRARDNKLIDALERVGSAKVEGEIWRVVREGHDVLMPSAAGGRWDDGTFDVLYTSKAADGAAAEAYFHLSRGQPVIPSKITHELYRLNVIVEKALILVDLSAIAALGVDTARYGALSYNERQQEYPRTQEVAETAHFLGFEALVAPNARWDCMNVILFSDRIAPGSCEVTLDGGPIDWKKWLSAPFGH